MENLNDLFAAISRLEEVDQQSETVPLLKLYSLDTGKRKVNAASISPSKTYLSFGFQDSSVAIWEVKKSRKKFKSSSQSDVSRKLDVSEASINHPKSSSKKSLPKNLLSGYSIGLGHSGPVYATQFTSTNTHMLSCSDDTTLRLWDISSMENLCVYRGHTYPVWDVSLYKQGQVFASASQDRTAKIWTYDRTYPIRTLVGHTADVNCVDFHPDGHFVATGSADSSVLMWYVDGRKARIFESHRGTVLSVAFSPSGKLLASAGEDHRVIVWDIRAARLLHDYAGHQCIVHGLVWIYEHLLCSYSADGNIRVWNVTMPVSSLSSSTPVLNQQQPSSSLPASQQQKPSSPLPASQQQPSSLLTDSQPEQLATHSIPLPTKIVHLERGNRKHNRDILVCITATFFN